MGGTDTHYLIFLKVKTYIGKTNKLYCQEKPGNSRTLSHTARSIYEYFTCLLLNINPQVSHPAHQKLPGFFCFNFLWSLLGRSQLHAKSPNVLSCLILTLSFAFPLLKQHLLLLHHLRHPKSSIPVAMKDFQANKNPQAESKKTTIPPYMKAISGSFGGVVEACCLQPIDVIKTRLQLDRMGNYKGILHCGATVSSTEGVRALWKGLTPFATHLTLKYALRMGSNAMLQSAFKDSDTGTLSNKARFLSGFGAGVLEALVIVTPFEVIYPPPQYSPN